jgi:hypothetical protein
MCNPWFYPLFGTVAMGVGQIFGPKLYPVMSNAGMLLFIITLLALMAEVDKDMVATHNVASFLIQVANIGDEISVTPRPRAVQSVRQAYIDQPSKNFRSLVRQSFKSEEKAVDSENAQPSNGNKSIHSVSTQVTEPTSNKKRAAVLTVEEQYVTISGSARDSSLSVDEAETVNQNPPESIAEEADTFINQQNERCADVKDDEVIQPQPVMESNTCDPNQTPNLQPTKGDGAEEEDVGHESEPINSDFENAITSKSIMKGLIEDVDVLIDEEIGEVGNLNDGLEDHDSFQSDTEVKSAAMDTK